jgi:coenzyme F420 hydrogenase subunit beta
MVDGKPKRPKKKAACKDCSVCFDSCYKTSGETMGQGHGIGHYRRLVAAKWNKSESYQDGGIVTALLKCAYDMKLIDGALLSSGEGWKPVPSVATCAEDFITSGGTKYGVSPVLMNLRPAIVEHELDKLAVVGTPCHIQAVRHLQRIKLELSPAVVFTIGLFCSENIEFGGISEQMNRMGVREEDVDRITVSNGKLIIQAGNRNTSIPVSDLKNWVPHHCQFCGDHTSELADISIGSEGSPEGWSTVVIRTEKGEEIFSKLENTSEVIISSIPTNEIEHLKAASGRKRHQSPPQAAHSNATKPIAQIYNSHNNKLYSSNNSKLYKLLKTANYTIFRTANTLTLENRIVFHGRGAGTCRAARVWLLRFLHQS